MNDKQQEQVQLLIDKMMLQDQIKHSQRKNLDFSHRMFSYLTYSSSLIFICVMFSQLQQLYRGC